MSNPISKGQTTQNADPVVTDPTPSTWWEWIPEVQWTHEINRIFCVPPDDINFGEIIDQDMKPAQKIVHLKGHGLQDSDIAVLETAVQARGAAFTVVDYRGMSYIGSVMSLTYTKLEALSLYDAAIQLRI